MNTDEFRMEFCRFAMERLSEWIDMLEVKTSKLISEIRSLKDKHKIDASVQTLTAAKTAGDMIIVRNSRLDVLCPVPPCLITTSP